MALCSCGMLAKPEKKYIFKFIHLIENQIKEQKYVCIT